MSPARAAAIEPRDRLRAIPGTLLEGVRCPSCHQNKRLFEQITASCIRHECKSRESCGYLMYWKPRQPLTPEVRAAWRAEALHQLGTSEGLIKWQRHGSSQMPL